MCACSFERAAAESLIPELPSVEVHLEALESLRERPAPPPQSMPTPISAQSVISERRVPSENPRAAMPQAPADVASPEFVPAPVLAPAPIAEQAASPVRRVPQENPQAVNAVSASAAKPAPSLAAPLPPVKSVPTTKPLVRGLSKITSPPKPQPALSNVSSVSEVTPKPAAPVLKSAPKPVSAVRTGETKSVSPELPAIKELPKPVTVAQPKPVSAEPNLDFSKLPPAKSVSEAIPALPVPALTATSKQQEKKPTVKPAIPEMAPIAELPKPTAASPVPMLDFRQLPATKPTNNAIPEIPAPVPLTEAKPVAPIAPADALPALALPSQIEMPAAPKPAESNDILVIAPESPSAEAQPALPPQPVTPEQEKHQSLFKSLSARAARLFVKEPEKEGILSDKTSITGQMQNMPQKPASESALPLPEINAVQPSAGTNTLLPATLPETSPLAAPEMPSNATPPKAGSMLDKLAKAANNAPVIPQMNGTVSGNEKPAPPALPPLPEAHAVVKPKQLSLEEVNKKAPPDSMSANNLLPEKPYTINTKADVLPALAAQEESAQKSPLSAAQPAAAAKTNLKPGKLAPLPVPETASVKPAANITSPDALAEMLPPPSEKPILADPKKSEVAPSLTAPALPALPKFDSLAPAAPAALPSLSALTGGAPAKSSMDIALDKEGVRAVPIAALQTATIEQKPAPATAENTIPSLAKTPAADLPKVTHTTALKPQPKPQAKAASAEKPAVKLVDAPAPPPLPVIAPVPVVDASKPIIAEGANVPAAALPVIAEKIPSPVSAPVIAPVTAPVLAPVVATSDAPVAKPVIAESIPAQAGAPAPATVARAVTLPIEKGSPLLSLTFEKDKTDVTLDMQGKITGIADKAKKADAVRILAYASGAADEKSAARRISLSRALQVRAKLIEKGIDPMKITVQALGNTDGASRDSAEIIVK